MMIETAAVHKGHRKAHGNNEQCNSCEFSDTCVNSCAAYGRVCPSTARAAAKGACTKIKALLKDSKIFHGKPQFRTVSDDEITIGKKLGEGGFSNVNVCTFRGDAMTETRAIKYLKRQIMVEPKSFGHGASDLATEAIFLATLSHPNIIKLHAVTAGSVESCVSGGKDAGYFIVIDRLVDTLEEKLDAWRTQMEQSPPSLFYRLSKEYKETQKDLLMQRLQFALDLAAVLDYLHGLNIAYRDLKPDNIGFDTTGVLKIFDFGLAREQKDVDRQSDGNYKMTGHTGSRRYMAPEVAKSLPYNKSVDVFSFGILLWEICSVQKPFQNYSSKKHYKDVVVGGERPKMDSSVASNWPVTLQLLIKNCWSADAESRPTFSVIKSRLIEIREELSQRSTDRLRVRSVGFDSKNASATSHIKKPTKGAWRTRSRS